MSTMTEAEELFGTFFKLWRAGKNAHLNIECHAGKVCATLRVNLLRPPHLPPQQHHQSHRRVGPSRLRRRARRAALRAQAAVQPAEDKTDETGKSVQEVKESRAAAKAAFIAVKAKPIPTNNDVVAVVENTAEEQNKEKTLQLPPTSSLNVLARPWPSRQQQEFHQDNHPTPQVPPNQCEKCGKTFGSNRALKTHRTKEHQISSM